MNKKILAGSAFMASFLMFMLSIVQVSAGDTYGMAAITDLFANLWSAVWPLVALLFIIEIVLKIFGAPSFVGSIFGAVKSRR